MDYKPNIISILAGIFYNAKGVLIFLRNLEIFKCLLLIIFSYHATRYTQIT